AKKLRMIAQFREVVRGWGRRRGKPPFMLRESVNQLPSGFAAEILDDAGLIQNDRSEHFRNEQFQPIIVADVDAFAGFILGANDAGIVAPLLSLPLNLPGDCQWRQDEP